jgi:hypothetical protein
MPSGSLKGLGPGPGPTRLYGESKTRAVQLLEELSDHMMFNGDFTEDERDFVAESLRSAHNGSIPRDSAPRLRKYVRAMRKAQA